MVLLIITGGQITPEIEVPSSATFLQVKEKIEDRLSVGVDRQNLYFDSIVLENDHIVGNFVTGRYGVLRLSVMPLLGEPKCNISVRFEDRDDARYVRMRETSTVADLRSKIGRRWGIIPTDRISMSHLSVEMLDDRLLTAYYITEGSEVDVKVEIEAR